MCSGFGSPTHDSRNSVARRSLSCLVLGGRALQILNRQLALRAQLVAAGQIHHDHLFFAATGAPIIHLRHPYVRWRRTLQRLAVRYRKPYCARHSSVSWNLMIGKNPLWVAKQHGHTITTMLRAYAAWAEGAAESDIAAIERAMEAVGAAPFGSGFGSSHCYPRAKCSIRRRLSGGKGGTRNFLDSMVPWIPRRSPDLSRNSSP